MKQISGLLPVAFANNISNFFQCQLPILPPFFLCKCIITLAPWKGAESHSGKEPFRRKHSSRTAEPQGQAEEASQGPKVFERCHQKNRRNGELPF
jgi:hypothetical protein